MKTVPFHPYFVKAVATDWGVRFQCVNALGEKLGGGMTMATRNSALAVAAKANACPLVFEMETFTIDTKGD